jgi:hypothetical protein
MYVQNNLWKFQARLLALGGSFHSNLLLFSVDFRCEDAKKSQSLGDIIFESLRADWKILKW